MFAKNKHILNDFKFASSKNKILIVNGTPDITDVLHKTLELEGYDLFVASNSRMAIEAAPRINPDLILLDIKTSELNGYEICRQLKENNRTCDFPVMFISAKNKVGDIVEGFRYGGVDYISRPFRCEEILCRIKTHVELSRMHKLREKRIRELEQQNRKLQELDEIKNQVLGNVIHELRNPISSIQGLSDLFVKQQGSFSESENNNLAGVINQTSKDLMRLVNDLLDISVFESGNLKLNLSPGNLSLIIQKKVQTSRLISMKKSIDIVTELNSVPDSLFDTNRMGQVLDNLISNAIKFSLPGTCVRVGLGLIKDRLEFYVKDEGPGIPHEERGLLFRGFPGINVHPTGDEKSTGLGLSIVKKIVEAHSGVIEVESQEGQGSSFYVRLPLMTTRKI